MIHSIHKYPLQVTDLQTIQLPRGAKILKVDVQRGIVYLWALVNLNPVMPKENHTIRIVGTGHDIDDRDVPQMNHIGTFQLYNGDFIGHAFEVK